MKALIICTALPFVRRHQARATVSILLRILLRLILTALRSRSFNHRISLLTAD
jgi:hypothetical protein